MFPGELDNAKVIWYTPKRNYGTVNYETGEICDHIAYLAICVYAGSSEYCLFFCNDKFEVIGDSVFDSVDECKRIADRSMGHSLSKDGWKGNVVWIEYTW